MLTLTVEQSQMYNLQHARDESELSLLQQLWRGRRLNWRKSSWNNARSSAFPSASTPSHLMGALPRWKMGRCIVLMELPSLLFTDLFQFLTQNGVCWTNDYRHLDRKFLDGSTTVLHDKSLWVTSDLWLWLVGILPECSPLFIDVWPSLEWFCHPSTCVMSLA